MAVKMPSRYEILINNQRGANQGQGTVARRVRQTSMASNTPKPSTSFYNKQAMGKGMFNLGKVFLSKMGDLTGDRIFQKNVNTMVRWGSIGYVAITNPAIATGMAVATVASNALTYQVDVYRSRNEKGVYRHISGNTETSGSRYGGRKR